MADDRMWDAFDREVQDFWPYEREMLAVIAELLHSLVRVTAGGFGAKNLPPQLRVPRPWDGSGNHKMRPQQPLISMGEFVKVLNEKG